LNQKQQRSLPALKNQFMSLGFLGIHQLSIKKRFFLIEGVFFLLTSPLMGDPQVLFALKKIHLRKKAARCNGWLSLKMLFLVSKPSL